MNKRVGWTAEDHEILVRACDRGHLEILTKMYYGDVEDDRIMGEHEYNRMLDAQYHNFCISEEEFYS